LDVEGAAVCGNTTTAVSYTLFFDIVTVVTTPEFGSSAIAVAGVALLLMMAVRRGTFGKKLSTV
jgi:hypothetical protein